jgi:mono/diheme cytochrome c family protein
MGMKRALLGIAGLGVACAVNLGCGGDTEQTPPLEPLPGIAIEAEPQREGDPVAGYHALVHRAYVGCGVPYSAYAQVFGPAPVAQRLPDREGKNAEAPYMFNVDTVASGVEVVAPSCLSCHAASFQGQLIVGLGDAQADLTVDNSEQIGLAGLLLTDPTEKAELEKFAERAQTIGPLSTPSTRGVNPAENIAAVLMAHRDRTTLAWSNEPLLGLPPEHVVPVDVPPWWRMKKKHAMFYVAAGRGDHARIMMTASTLCIDEVEQARAIDAYFADVRAFITSIEPPPYPFAIDQGLAAAGERVFAATCARCHGTYGATESYPNLLIPSAEIGTDATLAGASTQFADELVDWFNESFYGEISRVEPQDGYVAPPLDGIWVTAPFLHNGSVPTVEALLDSSKRPRFWTRSFNTADFDEVALGWKYTELEGGHDSEPNEAQRKKIYDTTQLGYGNGGHSYGDALSPDDRRAVIEYLKTL